MHAFDYKKSNILEALISSRDQDDPDRSRQPNGMPDLVNRLLVDLGVKLG